MTSFFINRPSSHHLFSFFIFAVLFLGYTAQAQTKVGFGPKFGPNVSIFRGDFPVSGMRKPHIGFCGGAYLMIRSMKQKRWQFEANVLYTVRGNNSNFLNTVDAETFNDEYKTAFDYNFGYIEIPLLMKYMLNKGGMTRPYLLFGPVYSGLLQAKFTNNNSGRDENAFDWISRDDFGLTVGWGITSFFIDRWYHLDVRLYNGFADISDNLANDIQKFRTSQQTRTSFYNTTFSVTLGVGLEKSETAFLR